MNSHVFNINMTSSQMKMIVHSCKYVHHLENDVYSITATDNNYSQWKLTIDSTVRFELLTATVIFNMFRRWQSIEYDLNMRIVFPLMETVEEVLPIKIFFFNDIVEKMVTLNLISTKNIMATMYDDEHRKFKKMVIDYYNQIPIQRELNYVIHCAVEITGDFASLRRVIDWFSEKKETINQKNLSISDTANIIDPTYMMDFAAEDGELDIVKWLYINEPHTCTHRAIDLAAATGRLDVIKWLHSKQKPCTTNAVDWASACGHIDVVKFLHENRSEGGTTNAMDMAAQNGHIDIVIYLHEHQYACTKYAAISGAMCGHLFIVKYLILHRKEASIEDILNAAYLCKRFEIIEYLQE